MKSFIRGAVLKVVSTFAAADVRRRKHWESPASPPRHLGGCVQNGILKPALIFSLLSFLCRPAFAQQASSAGPAPVAVAAGELPLIGTFRSLTLLQPPFPFNPFPELAVYSTGTGAYVYDDSQVDYVALRM